MKPYLIQHEGPLYAHYFLTEVGVSERLRQNYAFDFLQELDSDADTEFQFQLGAPEGRYRLYRQCFCRR